MQLQERCREGGGVAVNVAPSVGRIKGSPLVLSAPPQGSGAERVDSSD